MFYIEQFSAKWQLLILDLTLHTQSNLSLRVVVFLFLSVKLNFKVMVTHRGEIQNVLFCVDSAVSTRSLWRC